MKNLLAAILCAIAAACLAGCGERPQAAKFRLTDVTGASFGKELNLTDHDGKPRTLSLKELLAEFLRHRAIVIRRRTQFLLAKARQRKLTGVEASVNN